MGDAENPQPPLLNSLQSTDQAELLDQIDSLRNKGLSRYVSLPQLIVCGDQSSGKSSVLEAISKVAFPTNDGLCTRFVTEVSLRRTSRKAASVKILPAPDSSHERRERLKSINNSEVDLSKLPEVIEASKDAMGLSGDSSFCQDILQLEISGPDLPHLTLVDMPGLIHTPNKTQTSKDVEIVKLLAEKYMKSPRSIILAVVSAKYDRANQIVLQMAKSIDPDRLRTMGIITKPDTLKTDSPNEMLFVSLAKNQDISFRLGWHVLRNGDYADNMNPSFNRDETERLFFSDRPPWHSLPRSNVGIDALRTRLTKVLFDQIRNELPGLITDMESEAETCRGILKKLGPARGSTREQLRYLMNFTERFQALAQAGLRGHYSDPFFHLAAGKPSRRLRAVMRDLSQQFATDMEMHGHCRSIVNHPSAFGFPTQITRKDFLKEIQELLKESKGRELQGTFNPLLTFDLFVKHAEPWKRIAKRHIEECWNVTRMFVDELVDHIMDPAAKDLLLREIFDPAMEERFQTLSEKVDELLTPYMREFPATLNRQFVTKLDELREKRLQETLFDKTESADMDRYACSELLDCMLAYYHVALNVFVDNLEALAVENCLLRGLDEILSPTKITDMTSEELCKFGAESEESQQTRSEAESKLKILQDGLDICKRHAKRVPSTRVVPVTNSLTGLRNDSGKPKQLFGGANSSTTSGNLPTPQKTTHGMGFGTVRPLSPRPQRSEASPPTSTAPTTTVNATSSSKKSPSAFPNTAAAGVFGRPHSPTFNTAAAGVFGGSPSPTFNTVAAASSKGFGSSSSSLNTGDKRGSSTQ